jgi:sugar lactone lactonase YvrE
VAGGLTAVTGVAVHHGHTYALEAFTGFFAPTPDVAKTGTVVRLNPRTQAWETVVTGLSFPTAMTFDEEGNLFISNKGFGQPTSTAGEVVKVRLGSARDN